MRVGECTRRPGPTAPTLLQATVPTLLQAETLWVSTTVSNPPLKGEAMEGADNQGGKQGRAVRQIMHWGYRPRFHRGPPCHKKPKEDGNEENKDNQGDETQG